MRTCAPRPNDEVAPGNRAAAPLTRSATAAGRGGAALADATPTGATATREIRPCTRRRPRVTPSSRALSLHLAIVSRRPGRAGRHRGPSRLTPARPCPPGCGAFVRRDASLRRSRAGVRLAPFDLTNRLAKPIVGSVQPAVDPPLTEMVVDRLPRRVLFRQHPQRTPAPEQVEDGVRHVPQRPLRRTAALFGRREQRFED